jgi:hypothetical protein
MPKPIHIGISTFYFGFQIEAPRTAVFQWGHFVCTHDVFTHDFGFACVGSSAFLMCCLSPLSNFFNIINQPARQTKTNRDNINPSHSRDQP